MSRQEEHLIRVERSRLIGDIVRVALPRSSCREQAPRAKFLVPLLCRCLPTTCPAKTDPMRSYARLRSCLFAGLIATAFVAAPALAQVPASEYTARRDSLAARVRNGVVIGFGGRTPVTDFGPFYQLPAFHYLTNFHEPDAAFVMVVQNGRGTSTLFLTPIAPRRAFYYGRRPDSAAVVRDFGVRARNFDALARARLPFYVLDDFAAADFATQDSLTRGKQFIRALKARHASAIEVADAHPIVDELRARKSPAEM